MRSPFSIVTVFVLLSSSASAKKLDQKTTKALPLQGCEAASCPSDDQVCHVAQYGITRFGTVPDILNVSNTSVSLTLADLESHQQITDSDIDRGYSYTDHALFVGAPAGFNITEQKDACALVMLYDFQQLADDSRMSDTSCGKSLAESDCFKRLEGIIQSASAPSDPRDRCTELAQTISRNFTSSMGHIICGGFGSKFNVTGAPLLGRHASLPIRSSSGCSPVSPPEYKLHKTVDFGTIGPLKPWDRDDNHTTVPVVTVVFDNDENGEDADVQFMCLKTVTDTLGKTSSAAVQESIISGALLGLVGVFYAWTML
jgi:hypothetical protein